MLRVSPCANASGDTHGRTQQVAAPLHNDNDRLLSRASDADSQTEVGQLDGPMLEDLSGGQESVVPRARKLESWKGDIRRFSGSLYHLGQLNRGEVSACLLVLQNKGSDGIDHTINCRHQPTIRCKKESCTDNNLIVQCCGAQLLATRSRPVFNCIG